jgi:hypothetical protein
MPRLRRWPQWSLRSLLIAIAIASLAMGGIRTWLQARWAAVTECSCHSDAEVRWNLSVSPRIEWLGLVGPEVTDSGLREVAAYCQRGELRDLTTLVIGGAGVTDDGMKAIECLTQLTAIQIQDTPITDRGLEPIQSLCNLKRFHLFNNRQEPADTRPQPSDARITGRGLEYLGRLPKLSQVWLTHVSIGDDDLSRLETLPKDCQLRIFWANMSVDRVRAFKAKRPDTELWMDDAMEHKLEN